VFFPVSMLECTLIRHVGFQPLTTGSRSNPTPEGFEPLTKSSRSNSPTNCTLWHLFFFTPSIATHQNPPSTRHIRPLSLTSHLSAKDQVACLQPGMQFSAHPQCAGGAPNLLFVPDPIASATQSSLVAPTTTVLASTLFAVRPPCMPPK
jgi:hypothetical protein